MMSGNKFDIIEEVTDFDGTLTAMIGKHVVFSEWYYALLKNPNIKDYRLPLKPISEMVQIMKSEFHLEDKNKERHLARITEGAVNFLTEAFNSNQIKLTICTKNQKDYVKAQLLIEGFTNIDELEKNGKITIIEACGPEERLNLIFNKALMTNSQVRFHDDDKEPILECIKKYNGGFTDLKQPKNGFKMVSTDKRIILFLHCPKEDVEGELWDIEAEKIRFKKEKCFAKTGMFGGSASNSMNPEGGPSEREMLKRSK